MGKGPTAMYTIILKLMSSLGEMKINTVSPDGKTLEFPGGNHRRPTHGVGDMGREVTWVKLGRRKTLDM